MPTISLRRLVQNATADKKITKEEAQAVVNRVKVDGKVSVYETNLLRQVIAQNKDAFAPGALDTLNQILGQTPPPIRPSGTTIPLSETSADRPVFLAPNGSFVTAAGSAGPRDNVELGDGMFRVAEMADDNKNVFANLSAEMRAKVLENLTAAAAKVPSGGTGAQGLDAMQSNQLRASVATNLVALLEASPEPELSSKIANAYSGLVKNEKVPQLRESMIFNLHASDAARSGPVKEVSDAFMKDLAPLYPPYDKWFTAGNKTVNMEWTVGQGEFWQGFTNKLKENGFKAVGAENQYGATTYEKTVNKPGVGDTTFRITVREGGSNMMQPVGNSKVQIFGYDGHSNWGNNISSSVKSAPTAANGGDGQLFFYNMCVGKSGLDKVKDKFPNLQTVTTYAASNFYTDGQGHMTTGEGVQALMAMVDDVAARSPWTTIHKHMNQAANIGWGRTWDNYVTPVSTMVREKVLDRDNDGQADYLDKLYTFNTFRPTEDTRRELQPIRQDRPADTLDGTKVLMAGNMINTISEFSEIMEKPNRDSKVVPNGWFEPKDSERELVKFEKATGKDGKVEYRMKFNARYAHASEDCLRAIANYEFNRYLGQTGQLGLDPIDAKINGLILAQHSMSIDEGWRDQELWSAFLKKYNFPDIDYSLVDRVKESDPHHHYAGSTEVVRQLRAQLPPAVIEALKNPTVGEPT